MPRLCEPLRSGIWGRGVQGIPSRPRVQEVTKLAFNAAGSLQDSAESASEELRGIQGASSHPGPEGARMGSRLPDPQR